MKIEWEEVKGNGVEVIDKLINRCSDGWTIIQQYEDDGESVFLVEKDVEPTVFIMID